MNMMVDDNTLARLHWVRYTAKEFGHFMAFTALTGAAVAIAYKIAGFVVSVLTNGTFTLLGTLIVSSPLYYATLAVVAAAAAAAFLVEQVAALAFDQIRHR